MKTDYARVRSSISLRGHNFPAGTLIKVWDAGSVTSIQPVHLPSKKHEALWYSFPKIHFRNIVMLDRIECAMIDFGLL